MYSLVSAGVLAIDLARHPSGTSVADVVDRVLSLTAEDLDALSLSSPAPGEVRDRVLVHSGTTPMTTALRQVRHGLATGLPDAVRGAALRTTLTEALLGSLADLHEMLRREQPLVDAPPTAVQVSLDAVTTAWAGRQADLADLSRLRAPWRDALGAVPASLPQRPWSPALAAVLDEVPRRSRAAWARSVTAHREQRAASRWSERMHDACWAVHHADRVVDVARAHLAAARSLRLCEASTSPEAHAHGMVLAGAVQAVSAADLLDTRALLEPWEAGS